MHSGNLLQATENKSAAPCVVGEARVCTFRRTTALVGLSGGGRDVVLINCKKKKKKEMGVEVIKSIDQYINFFIEKKFSA